MEEMLLKYWPLAALMMACYVVGRVVRQFALSSTKNADLPDASEAVQLLSRWRRVLAPSSSLIVGILGGLAGVPATGSLVMEVTLGICCGGGPVALTGYLREIRKAKSPQD